MNTSSNFEKFLKAAPMNSTEECKCVECQRIILEKELFMQCQMKEYSGTGFVDKIFCCDCFKKKVEDDIERIRKWSGKTIQELMNMLSPIQAYMQSETKKILDNNRKMLDKIEDKDDVDVDMELI